MQRPLRHSSDLRQDFPCSILHTRMAHSASLIRVAVVEDRAPDLENLRTLLANQSGFECVAACHSAEEAISELHVLLSAGPEPSLPPAVLKNACEECSLYKVCLPQVTSQPAALAQASRALFQT